MTRTVRSSATGSPVGGELNNQPSLTVPHQALTIREILARYASGTVPDVMTRDENYSEDNEDLRGIDIAEYHDLRTSNRVEIETLKERAQSEQKQLVEPEKPQEDGPNNTSSD